MASWSWRNARPAAFLCCLLALGCTAIGGTGDAHCSLSARSGGKEECHDMTVTNLRLASVSPAAGEWSKRPDQNTTFKPNVKTILAGSAVGVAGLLANAAGIGGGPLFLPVLVNVLGFPVRLATVLSHTIVASSAVASTAYGLWHTSPSHPDRSLTDLDLALLLIPSLLLGVSIGVVFNSIFPEWLQIVLLTVLLTAVIINTFKKALKLWHSEQKEASRNKDAAGLRAPARPTPDHNILGNDAPLLLESDSEGSEEEVTLDEGSLLKASSIRRHNASIAAAAAAVRAEEGAARTPTLRDQVAGFWKRLPLKQLAGIVVLWGVFLGLQVAKSSVPKCSNPYWIYFAAQVGLLLLVTGLVLLIESRKAHSNAEDLSPEIAALLGEGPAQGHSPKMQPGWALFVISFMVFVSGILAGCLGIGGAILFGPLLIAQGVQPQVVASTSVACILFSSSTIGISGYLLGLLNTSYAAVFGTIGFIASFIGVTLVGRIVRKSGRTSIIVFILAGLITVGTIVTAVLGGIRSYHNIREGTDVSFHSFC